jgi:exosortase/archaeosortase family protein
MQIAKRSINILIKVLPILSFTIPLLILYFLDPHSFERTWRGRAFYIFFLWVAFLEVILNWEKLQTKKMNKLWSIRTIAFIIALLLPTIYVVAANYYGLNALVVNLSKKSNVPLADWMPLSMEYLILTVLFTLIILTPYGIDGLQDWGVSVLFLGIVGVINITNDLYPNGRFSPFQIIVPTTATLAASVLNLMGYQTLWIGTIDGMPTFRAWDSMGRYSNFFSIAWPCAGVESLLLYTVTILLFLNKTPISWKHKIFYFIVGAAVTYFINILRIVTIYVISINKGDVGSFHNLYGQLFSITWIISYPLIIIGSRNLWSKIKHRKTSRSDVSGYSVNYKSEV